MDDVLDHFLRHGVGEVRLVISADHTSQQVLPGSLSSLELGDLTRAFFEGNILVT